MKLGGYGCFRVAMYLMPTGAAIAEEKVQKLMSHYKEILSLLGEDPEREGLLKTPERVAKAMLTLTRGYVFSTSSSSFV